MEYSQCGRCAELGNEGVPVTTLIKVEPIEENWPDAVFPPLMGQLCDEHAQVVRDFYARHRDDLTVIEDARLV